MRPGTRQIAFSRLVIAMSCAGWMSGAAAAGYWGGEPGGEPGGAWQHVPLNARKTPTRYEVARHEGEIVLAADARGAVSLVMRAADVDLERAPVVTWRWRLDEHPTGADNSIAAREDAAARVVFVFDGDRSRLPFQDRAVMRVARSLSGRDLPYATLMYVSSPQAAVGTIVPNPHTRRVQMIVASTDPGGPGGWHSLRRDLVRDFERAFGELPGRLIAYGVMTDSDNTASRARARYGPIRFVPR